MRSHNLDAERKVCHAFDCLHCLLIQGPVVFMTAGLEDVTADTAATVMASPFAIKFSNYAVADPTQPYSHIWGCRTVVQFPKQDPTSFKMAENLCLTGGLKHNASTLPCLDI